MASRSICLSLSISWVYDLRPNRGLVGRAASRVSIVANYGVDPLDGAFERVIRANEHLQELQGELGNVFERQALGVRFELDDQPPHRIRIVAYPPETFFGMRVGILVGEVCYNLRSALDYLVFELSKHDSGAAQKQTQFPVTDTKKEFDIVGPTKRLKGISAAHIAEFERLQPFSGCDWTRRLRDYSNPDKHKEFVVMGGETRITVHSALDTDLSTIRGTTFDATTPHPITGQDVAVKVHVYGSVTFDDGSEILETLGVISREVTRTLEMFKGAF